MNHEAGINVIDLSGRVALVTGSSDGIGLAIAVALGTAGARVAINGRSHERLASARQVVHNTGANVVALLGDCQRPSDIERIVRKCAEKFGGIDILVNAVGGESPPKSLELLTLADWRATFALNLESAFLATRAAIPYLRASTAGRVVNITSRAARETSRFGDAAYTAAKSGMAGLTRHLARDLAPLGILVNAVAPGLILSGTRAQAKWDALTEEQRRQVCNGIPLGRPGRPEEIAAAVQIGRAHV